MKKILLVEDNAIIVKGLLHLLQKEYLVDIATTYKEAMSLINNIYDLIILDISLPDGNGFDIASQVSKSPIIFLTANDLEEDIVKGLETAEDYIVKPFRNNELVARIKKVLLRTNSDYLYYKNIVVDINKSQVYVDNSRIEFTNIEYQILMLLFTNINKVITRDRILSVIWDENNKFVNDNTLSVNIKRIRQKLNSNYIQTIKGMGYMVSIDNDD